MKTHRMRIAHISDPHFGTTTSEKKESLKRRLLSLTPDLVALSGDVTQRARRSQFLEARNFCDSLSPLPVVSVPGNHDIPLFNFPARFLLPYNGFKKIFKSPTSGQRTMGAVELIAVNSTDPMRHIQGDLTEHDSNLISQFSDQSLFRIVMLHHPLDCAKSVDEKNLLKEPEHAISLFENAKVDLLLSGHIHDPLARLTNVRYPQVQRPLISALAGTCLSSRTRSGAPNSFNLIDIQLDEQNVKLEITRYDLTDQGDFQPLHTASFYRHGRDHWTTSI